MSEPNTMLAEQFDNLEQQQEVSRLGMWTFLATEIMFFGGLIMAYIIYRHAYPQEFAIASAHTNVTYGTINTAILLTSSFWMALAVNAAQTGRSQQLVRFLSLTILFAVAFLGVKALEYSDDLRQHLFPGPAFALQGETQLFFYFYWAMTALHGLHVLIGIGVLSGITLRARQRFYSKEYNSPVEVAGLYWHFVDVVWIVLYPLLYLINRHV